MNFARKVVPAVAVVGISLVLAVGFDRVLRLGTEAGSDASITITVSSTPDALAEWASSAESHHPVTTSGSQLQLSSTVFEADASISDSGGEPSVCGSTVTGVRTGNAHHVPSNSVAIDTSTGQLNSGYVVDAISTASPLAGTVGIGSRPIPEAL